MIKICISQVSCGRIVDIEADRSSLWLLFIRKGMFIHMGGNFGFIREKIEIKILILFILRRLLEPITFEALTELAMCDGAISYFDYTECISELLQTEHIKFEDDKYSITDKGVRNGETTESGLPFSVRRIVEHSTFALRIKQNRNAMITTYRSRNPDGSGIVNLVLSDGIGDVISMKLFAANDEQARSLENGFRKNAESIYNTLIEMILTKE